MKKSYKILHEDEDILVLDKSGHVLTIPDRFDPTKPNLRQMLINRYGDIYVVHRLDFETSGVILFARNEIAHKSISDQFQNREVSKIYNSISSLPSTPSGVIHENLSENQHKKGTYRVSHEGKEALTKYKTIEVFGQYALLELDLLTGRTHQIRVHLKHIGASLLTDKKYGLYENFYLSQIKRLNLKKDDTERPLLSRTSLHSSKLTIDHPTSGSSITFEAPLHKDMKAVIYQMRKRFNR